MITDRQALRSTVAPLRTLGKILGDRADQHLRGFPAVDIHIMLSGLLSKLIDE